MKRNMHREWETTVETSRDAPRRKIFYRSRSSLLLWTVLRAGGCRSVRRRRERLAHWRAWHASGVRTIDELCSGRAIPNRQELSRVQTLLWTWADLQTISPLREPFGELCGLRVGYHTTGVVLACQFRQGLPPFHVPGRYLSRPPVVFRLSPVGCLERGVTPLLRDP